MNILITSAGRRSYIIEYFKKALNGTGKVYAGNSTMFSSAFYYADESVITPLIYDDDYIPFLIDFCKKKNIEAILSLFDVDLLILARNKKVFSEQGIRVIVSEEAAIQICNDKWKTYKFCVQNDIPVPRTYLTLIEARQALDNSELSFPLIVKPRWGMGSIGIFQADDLLEMEVFSHKCKKEIQNTYIKYEAAVDFDNCIIIQEKLSGEEYGIDVINNLDGRFCCDVVRRKHAMRAGETDCATVIQNTAMDEFAGKLSDTLRHIGNLDVDVFWHEDKVYLLEMNARFGGGYPFSHLAGINLPLAIIKWLKNEPLSDELKVKEYYQMFQKDICFVNLTKNG